MGVHPNIRTDAQASRGIGGLFWVPTIMTPTLGQPAESASGVPAGGASRPTGTASVGADFLSLLFNLSFWAAQTGTPNPLR
jgi:hypothetical protein